MKHIIIGILFLFTSNAALAFPITSKYMTPMYLDKDYDFEGIVALNNCSGSLVKLKNSKDTDRALVFTNGHCIDSHGHARGPMVATLPYNFIRS